MIVALCCGKGSPGATFLGINLALEFARRGERWLFVELDNSGGDAVAYLSLNPSRGLNTLSLLPGAELSSAETLLSESEERLGALFVTGFPRQGSISQELATKVLDAMQSSTIPIIVDLGRVDRMTSVVARSADLVLVAVRPDDVSIYGADRTLHFLESEGVKRDRIRLVVTGWERRRAADLTEIEDALHATVLGMIPLDRAAARRAARERTGVKGRRINNAFSELAESNLSLSNSSTGNTSGPADEVEEIRRP